MNPKLASSISSITRRHPKAVDALRKALPLSLKRKIGSSLLPTAEGGETKANDGRIFRTIPDRVFLQVVYDGIFEPSLSNFMLAHVEEGDVCVDVGSNFGWFATLLATSAKTVVAYEPAGRIRSILEDNVSLNNMGEKIVVRDVAVGREAGNVTFVIEGDAKAESALGHVATDSSDLENTETVEIVSLQDDLSQHLGEISLMKIDAEGFEFEALVGAEKILSNENPPIIITEANEGTLTRSGSCREDLCKELEKYGYELFGMRDNGDLYPDDKAAPALVGKPPHGKFLARFS